MDGLKKLLFMIAVFLLLVLGVVPLGAQDYKKCVMIETYQGEKLEYYISSNPRFTQDNDKVMFTSDASSLEFRTENIKKVYVSEGNYKLVYMLDDVIYKTYYHHAGVGLPLEPYPTPVPEGHSFSGWSQNPSIMPSSNVTITGSFNVNKYRLTYMVDGVEYKSFDVEYGASITPLEVPMKEGYTFSGWSEIPPTMPAHDVTVYGTFTSGQYKLIYMLDGVLYKELNLDAGAAVTPEPAPVKEGYTFSGWSEIPPTMPAHDVTITGSFSINSYTITYIIDEEVFMTETLVFGSIITPPEAPVRDGYEFSWGSYPSMMPAYDVIVVGTYTDTAITGIDNVLSRQKVAYSGQDYICLSGLQPEEIVGVYDLSGKLVKVLYSSSGGYLIISLSTFTAGVYVIKTNQQTFKVIRK